METAVVKELAVRIKSNIGKVIVGKDDVVDLLLVCLIGSGHALLEDVPGTGKTLLAKTLSQSLKLRFKRIQFTPDLLPSDLSGIHYYNQKSGEFEFRPGPLFTNILLADEINRATPRTQSSLLECMEERQITVDGETKRLERPFMVIATQNPVENQGTFPLPEAQLDRFLVKIRMRYPTKREGVEILRRFIGEHPLESIEAVVGPDELLQAQSLFHRVHVTESLMEYIVEVAERTRMSEDVSLGVSPRGTQALLKASQVYAILQGRDYVNPDDIKAMAVPVLAHRIMVKGALRMKPGAAEALLEKLLAEVPVPAETASAAE